MRLALRLGDMAETREKKNLVERCFSRGWGRIGEAGGVEDLDVCWIGEDGVGFVIV